MHVNFTWDNLKIKLKIKMFKSIHIIVNVFIIFSNLNVIIENRNTVQEKTAGEWEVDRGNVWEVKEC